ncbi:hypothetical protein FHU13_002626 [Methylobacterium sp. R2-1]|nr:hypothetical protein [Methylobacterium sp. R2-1]
MALSLASGPAAVASRTLAPNLLAPSGKLQVGMRLLRLIGLLCAHDMPLSDGSCAKGVSDRH